MTKLFPSLLQGSSLAVGVVQTDSAQDKKENLRVAAKLVRECAARGAKLVVLPEVFAWRGNMKEELPYAESLNGPVVRALKKMASDNGVALIGGSFLEKTGDSHKAYNTMLALAPSGEILAAYRKLHLFDIDRKGAVTMLESGTRSPGPTPEIAAYGKLPLGLAICYDLRFPELFRYYALHGAQGFCVGAAFTLMTGKDHWHLLARARAVENQCFLAAANQWGKRGGTPNYGHSLVVDAWGNVLADVGEGEGCAVAVVDLAAQKKLRQEFPVLDHLKDHWRQGLKGL